jgi:putative tryptophan/tyrosine transport system substrate-binding protein
MRLDQLKRRDFITLLGGAAAAWPLAVRAQQVGKPPTIGFLGANPAVWTSWTAAFSERLRELGWLEGRTINIVFALANDPLGSGLIASLARPGGNVTGLSNQAADLGSKRLELLREIVPNLHRLAVIFDAGYPGPCWRRATLRPRLAPSASKSSSWKSGERRILRPHSKL